MVSPGFAPGSSVAEWARDETRMLFVNRVEFGTRVREPSSAWSTARHGAEGEHHQLGGAGDQTRDVQIQLAARAEAGERGLRQ